MADGYCCFIHLTHSTQQKQSSGLHCNGNVNKRVAMQHGEELFVEHVLASKAVGYGSERYDEGLKNKFGNAGVAADAWGDGGVAAPVRKDDVCWLS